MLNDRDQQTLNGLEDQLLLEDPVLVQQFRNIGPPKVAEKSRPPAKRPNKSSPHWDHQIVTMLLVVTALFMAFVAFRGVLGAAVGVTLIAAAVAWSRYWTRPVADQDRCGG